MPQIKPITDLRNTNEIFERCHVKTNEYLLKYHDNLTKSKEK